MSNKIPNPSAGLILFFILTTLYFPMKYYAKENKNLIFYIYLAILIITQVFVNLDLSEKICGNTQPLLAILVTIIPWILIFGVFILMVISFPGWLKPFASTFGYAVIKILGVSSLIRKIFKEKTIVDDISSLNNNEKVIQSSLAQIYENESLLINEISPNNFEEFWNTSNILFKKNVFNDEKLKLKFEQFVNIKYYISEYIWYMLLGSLITSASYNFIINASCKKSLTNLKNNEKTYTEKKQEDVYYG
tara:strand:+ start:3569 stop:4312 length:744 start_codon:yes stop_codon:yes gene_type:complete